MNGRVMQLVVAVACVPLSALLTLAALPLWRWIEARTGIESIGHSGPAGWCWLVTLVLCLALALACPWRVERGDAA
ncbi:MAG TPA: hypothetical protein VM576_04420 [Xanthomonadaceae bacterium]|nr:hypothetical protein [Xanthomonadaceae bacterium]